MRVDLATKQEGKVISFIEFGPGRINGGFGNGNNPELQTSLVLTQVLLDMADLEINSRLVMTPFLLVHLNGRSKQEG